MPLPRITPQAALRWKLALFFAGALLFLLAVLLKRRELVIAAMVPLGVAFLLRFANREPRQTEVHPSWFDEEEPK